MEQTHFASLYPDNSRFAEIEKLLAFVKNGNSCQLISLPGVGRSTVFELLTFNHTLRIKHLGENQKWFHFVLTDFSQARNKSLTEVTKLMFLALLESLQERNMTEEYKKIENIFKESFVLADELVLFQRFKKAIDFLALEKELTIIMLFDRFEEYIPIITKAFFANLKTIRNHAKYRFSVILSLSRPLEDIIEPTIFADFYEFLSGHTVFLPIVDKPGIDFRIAYLEKVSGNTIDKKILDKIIHLTYGHGKLTRCCVETVINTETAKQLNNNELVTFFLKQKSVQGGLWEIWQSLNPHEQQFVATNIGLDEKDNQHLANVGLVNNGKITIPLFMAFVKEYGQLIIKQSNNQTFSYNATTNEITKGTLIISDKLTFFEFKLLRFLIQNSNRVVDREEIINATWQSQASVIGVTEQALDQLIFRLRHKIEDNPNNPTYLQTAKGRGFRFTP